MFRNTPAVDGLMTLASSRRPPLAGFCRAERTRFSSATGLLVVGHGTADPVGAAETAAVAALIAEQSPQTPVELGYLEVIEPSIEMAVECLVDRGCRDIVALPILLFSAGHAKRDVPGALAAAVSRRGLRVRQAAPLGLHTHLIELARRRFLEAVANRPAYGPDEEAILVVGRGSSDPTAVRQLSRFVEAVYDPLPRAVGRQRSLGFVAAARPTLAEAIEACGRPSAGRPVVKRVVVHPHLLFHGHVETQVANRLTDARAAYPSIEWLQVERLGAAQEVATALLERGREVLQAGRNCGIYPPVPSLGPK